MSVGKLSLPKKGTKLKHRSAVGGGEGGADQADLDENLMVKLQVRTFFFFFFLKIYFTSALNKTGWYTTYF